jgi:hypothetical protein
MPKNQHRLRPGKCPMPACTAGRQSDLRNHFRMHPDYIFKSAQVEPLGFVACVCGLVLANKATLKQHCKKEPHAGRLRDYAAQIAAATGMDDDEDPPDATLGSAEQQERLFELPAITRELPAQHALLLLRLSLQHKLRHLMRTLVLTDEVNAVWEEWDTCLLRAILKLRGQCNDEQFVDRLIVQLPVRCGGLGVLSHAELAVHARAALTEASDERIEKLFDADHEEEEVVPQRTRCRPTIDRHFLEVFEKCETEEQRRTFADNQAPLATVWLSAIPTNNYTSLPKEVVATGLHTLTLTPGHNSGPDRPAHHGAGLIQARVERV